MKKERMTNDKLRYPCPFLYNPTLLETPYTQPWTEEILHWINSKVGYMEGSAKPVCPSILL